jgi:hypothetical protein
MPAYRYGDEHTPPPALQVTAVAITRFEHVFEVDPSLMADNVTQQTFPNWDTLRIVRSRHDHLEWMHRHWADAVVSGQAILHEITSESLPSETPPHPGDTSPQTQQDTTHEIGSPHADY